MKRRSFLGLLPALVAGFKGACTKVKEFCGFKCVIVEGRVCMDVRAISKIKID